ncbi:MAG: tRNA (adenosine(37)-N6)-threonylcarbamoyltransferase complex ATPase subunit type 1 TsaE [Candidatus Aminicenantes bacterium RBG_13_63_10]|nr:MAG: tRNA (adenosine(37)-N6)-threonylcarbamoyltransferase complex ATPase subunit type 1 TsaE [Candidatus Aminicenantes bacterium RBG_13_63_10]
MSRPPRPAPRETTTASEEETIRLARDLAKSFNGREVVLLTGELGAGKTVFVKGLAAGLGMKDTRSVCSPSYTLLNIYQAKFAIYHFDLYRLSRTSEVRDLGLEDFLENGVVVVEWAEKLPPDIQGIRVTIKVGKAGRRTIRVER